MMSYRNFRIGNSINEMSAMVVNGSERVNEMASFLMPVIEEPECADGFCHAFFI